ncbi:MAG: FAD-dependent oxidoreductase [Candidatus Babeliaceae bacterium]
MRLLKIGFCFNFFLFLLIFHQNICTDAQPLITDIAIIGAGPAGLTASCYAAYSGYHTTLITGDLIGGQLLGARLVENMPGVPPQPGFQITELMEKQARAAGTHFLYDSVITINPQQINSFFNLQLASGSVVQGRTVIIATGGSPRRLDIPGESTYWGKGVYACALCDGFAVEGLDAAIVGGGNAAVEQALILAPLARSITIFVRKNRMRAGRWMQEQLTLYPHIKIVFNHEIMQVLGDDERMTSLEIKNLETEEKILFPLDGLFLAIGYIPNNSLCASFLPLTEQGYVHLFSRSQQTVIPGIFVAGEIANPHYRQVGIETGHAIQAGLEAIDYLRTQGIRVRKKRGRNSYFSGSELH